MGVFLSLRDDDSFHTLIIKKSVGEYTFFCSLGYSGGGTFDEFYGKFKYNDQNVITGFYSNSLGSGEWEEKITSVKFDSIDQRFKVQKEDLFELMDTKYFLLFKKKKLSTTHCTNKKIVSTNQKRQN